MIIDGNSIGYAAQSAKPLTVNGLEVQAVFNSFRTLRTLLFFKPQYAKSVLWLWDDKAKWRYDLYPDYKGKRKDTTEKIDMKVMYENAAPFIREGLTHLGVTQMWATGFEADDLAGYLSRVAVRANHKELLVTGDQDWLQLVCHSISWMDARDKDARFCDSETFKQYTGVDTPQQFLEMKVLKGDVSDNITGVGGIGDKAARAIIEHFGSVENLGKLKQSEKILTKNNTPQDLHRFLKPLNALFDTNYGVYRRNYQLMNLCDESRDGEIRSQIKGIKGNLNPDAFVNLCTSLKFNSILTGFDEWMKPFTGIGRKAA